MSHAMCQSHELFLYISFDFHNALMTYYVNVTVLDFVKRRDLFVLVQTLSLDYFMPGIQKSATPWNITCTGSKSPPGIILNIVYNLKLYNDIIHVEHFLLYLYIFPIRNIICK